MDENEIEIEIDVAEAIAGEIDAADDATAAAPAGFSPLHGTGETVDSIHYAPGTQPMAAGLSVQQHGGAGTRPIDAGFNVAADDLSAVRAQVEKGPSRNGGFTSEARAGVCRTARCRCRSR